MILINEIFSIETPSPPQCLGNNGFCEVYTYYGPAGVPFRDACLLLSDCLVLDACEDCYTEDVGSDCTSTCDAPVEGILGRAELIPQNWESTIYTKKGSNLETFLIFVNLFPQVLFACLGTRAAAAQQWNSQNLSSK